MPNEFRQDAIGGRTFLKVHLMQGNSVFVRSTKGEHYLTCQGKRATDIHPTEIDLVHELQERHRINFRSMVCHGSQEVEPGVYQFEWAKPRGR